MHGSGAFVAVDIAKLGVALGQVAVALRRVLIDQDVARAVHRLQPVLGVVQLHRRVHVFGVDLFVAGHLPQLALHDVRRVDKLVAAAKALVAHPAFHLLADQAALRVPENQARSRELLNGEQVELLAEHAVVARLDLFQVLEMCVEVFLLKERGAVDALELRILFIAQPVRTGNTHHLERAHAPGGWHVRSAAEVEEVAVAIERDVLAGLGELRDEVHLHEVALLLVAPQRFFVRDVLVAEGFVARDHLCHLRFDGDQIVRREGLLAQDVVKEAAVRRGSVAELYAGIQLRDGRRHDVRGRVAHDTQRLGIALLQQPQRDVFVQRLGQVNDALCRGGLGIHALFGARAAMRVIGLLLGAVRGGLAGRRANLRDDNSVGKSRRDAVRDGKRRGAARHFADAAIGKGDLDAG